MNNEIAYKIKAKSIPEIFDDIQEDLDKLFIDGLISGKCGCRIDKNGKLETLSQEELDDIFKNAEIVEDGTGLIEETIKLRNDAK